MLAIKRQIARLLNVSKRRKCIDSQELAELFLLSESPICEFFQSYFSFVQVEFHRFLPFVHDDLSDSLRRMDRAFVGLHESGSKTGEKLALPANPEFHSNSG